MGDYLLSVIAAAILVSVLTLLIQDKGALSGIFRLLGGVFLLIVLIQPVSRFDFGYIETFLAEISPDAELAASQGEEMARIQISEIIKSETEAYILDKARLIHADIQAEITLSDDTIPVPAFVTIRGDVPEQTKELLQNLLETELNIPKECQKWIGSS